MEERLVKEPFSGLESMGNVVQSNYDIRPSTLTVHMAKQTF